VFSFALKRLKVGGLAEARDRRNLYAAVTFPDKGSHRLVFLKKKGNGYKFCDEMTLNVFFELRFIL
jgi:hypothetical protein